jgi:hypothetical protein
MNVNALACVDALNARAKEWTLDVLPARARDDVWYSVKGTVLPTGRKIGALPFYGGRRRTPSAALESGVEAMTRRAEGL